MSKEGNLKGVEREALVVAEFAKLGWETFSGNGCTSCDLVVMKDKVLLRVEVKGTSKHQPNPSGPVSSTPSTNCSTLDCREFDIVVRVGPDARLHWQRSSRYLGDAYNLPLKEGSHIRTTKKNLSRAQSMESQECR